MRFSSRRLAATLVVALALLACADAKKKKTNRNPALGLCTGWLWCRTLFSEAECLGSYSTTFGASSTEIPSCTWRKVLPDAVIDKQTFQTIIGTGSVDLGKYKESFADGTCGATVTVTLADDLKGQVGLAAELTGPPNNKATGWSDPLAPGLEGTAAAGFAGIDGNPSSVTLSLALPPALGRRTANVTKKALRSFPQRVNVGFVTASPDLISQYSTNNRLYESSYIGYTVSVTAHRCTPAGAPVGLGATPIVADSAVFGPTFYRLYDAAAKHFSMTSYRTSLVTGVTGATWNVKVDRTLGAGTATQLTVFLLSEADAAAWAASCDGVCDPPTDKALPGTLCTDTACSGAASGLAPGGRYALWVSYPKAWGPGSNAYSSNSSPVSPRYTREVVTTVVEAASWARSTKA